MAGNNLMGNTWRPRSIEDTVDAGVHPVVAAMRLAQKSTPQGSGLVVGGMDLKARPWVAKDGPEAGYTYQRRNGVASCLKATHPTQQIDRLTCMGMNPQDYFVLAKSLGVNPVQELITNKSGPDIPKKGKGRKDKKKKRKKEKKASKKKTKKKKAKKKVKKAKKKKKQKKESSSSSSSEASASSSGGSSSSVKKRSSKRSQSPAEESRSPSSGASDGRRKKKRRRHSDSAAVEEAEEEERPAKRTKGSKQSSSSSSSDGSQGSPGTDEGRRSPEAEGEEQEY